jgi:hypothetical protein
MFETTSLPGTPLLIVNQEQLPGFRSARHSKMIEMRLKMFPHWIRELIRRFAGKNLQQAGVGNLFHRSVLKFGFIFDNCSKGLQFPALLQAVNEWLGRLVIGYCLLVIGCLSIGMVVGFSMVRRVYSALTNSRLRTHDSRFGVQACIQTLVTSIP